MLTDVDDSTVVFPIVAVRIQELEMLLQQERRQRETEVRQETSRLEDEFRNRLDRQIQETTAGWQSGYIYCIVPHFTCFC